jgi:hypothetical protein
MKHLSARKKVEALTRVEVLVVVLASLSVVVFLSPWLLGMGRIRPRMDYCPNNLKQVGLAFRTWAIDNQDVFPALTSTNHEGTKELVGTGQVFIHYRVMSNELSTPKILVCPKDEAKSTAKDFGSGFSDSNVSYFVGTDAKETQPQMLLAGDRNLAVQGKLIKPGLFVLTTNDSGFGWAKGFHHPCGWIGLADGSVESFDAERLASAITKQGVATNLLAVP